jgi:Tfp pilus assembly protein PilZ
MDSEFKIDVLCLFCQAPLRADENTDFVSGDLIKCKSCGEKNDYDSVIEVAKEKGVEKVKSQVEDELAKTMKSLFK